MAVDGTASGWSSRSIGYGSWDRGLSRSNSPDALLRSPGRMRNGLPRAITCRTAPGTRSLLSWAAHGSWWVLAGREPTRGATGSTVAPCPSRSRIAHPHRARVDGADQFEAGRATGLGVHARQVHLDRLPAVMHRSRDLPIGQALAHQPHQLDLRLREVGRRLRDPTRHRLPPGAQPGRGPPPPGRGTERVERLVRLGEV